MKHQKPLSVESATRLVDAFLDGDTSPVEEESLYAFFHNSPVGSLPDTLEAFRPMFDWYSKLKPEKSKRIVSFWSRFKYVGVACATAAVVAAASFIARDNMTYEDPLYAMYDGSYIIRNGQRISDMDIILSSVMRAERLADSLETVAAREEELLDCDYDRILVETALSNVADPALASELKNELLDESYENQ